MQVLVPFAVQPISERAVQTAINMFGDDEEVQIIAAHVTDSPDAPAEIAASEIEAMGEDAPASIVADVHQVASGGDSKAAVRDLLEELVNERDIDLVVLGHEEKSLLRQVFESDTAERMLETHDVPVLLVP